MCEQLSTDKFFAGPVLNDFVARMFKPVKLTKNFALSVILCQKFIK